MSTRTKDEHLEEMHRRIDGLEAKARAVRADARESMRGQIAVLRRQEESARAALREARDARASAISERVAAAEGKLLQLEMRLKAAQDALAAELAEDKKTFNDAMQANLDDVTALVERMDKHAAAMAGSAREQAEAAMNDIHGTRDNVIARFADLREASDERWRERREEVLTARAELERKVDEFLKKFDQR
jgi:hypothetical protein